MIVERVCVLTMIFYGVGTETETSAVAATTDGRAITTSELTI